MKCLSVAACLCIPALISVRAQSPPEKNASRTQILYSIAEKSENTRTFESAALVGDPPHCFGGAIWEEQITSSGRHILTKVAENGTVTVFDPQKQADVFFSPGIDGFLRSSVSSGEVAIFVSGTRESNSKTVTYTLPDGSSVNQKVSAGIPQTFALLYRGDGSYREATALSSSLEVHTVARFRSGKFALIGLDKLTGESVLSVLDARGRLDQNVALGTRIEANSPALSQMPQTQAKSASIKQKAGWSLDVLQILNLGDSLLLLQPGTTRPILRVYADGFLEEIPLRLLQGWDLDTGLVSENDLYLRLRHNGESEGKGKLVQIDPNSGEMVREILLGDREIWEVSCITHDKVSVIDSASLANHKITFSEHELVAHPQ